MLVASRSVQGYIGLNQRNNFSESGLYVDGVYNCEVPDASGMNDTLYVGIYSGPVCKLPSFCTCTVNLVQQHENIYPARPCMIKI